MKTLIILFLIMPLACQVVHGQTHYGTGSGTLGNDYNSYFGYYTGNASTTSTIRNSFMGAYSGLNTSANHNTAMGFRSLEENVNGHSNTVFGVDALSNQEDGSEHVAIGRNALRNFVESDIHVHDGIAGKNVAYGYGAAFSHLISTYTTAVGSLAMEKADSSRYSLAVGFNALGNHEAPYKNTAIGAYASQETRGTLSTAFGSYALNLNGSVEGRSNSAFGFKALYRADPADCSVLKNTAFGAYAGISPRLSSYCNIENTTAIGYFSLVTSSNQIRLGNFDVTSIGGAVSWSVLSDGRFKKDLQSDIAGVEFIDRLNPVSYSIDKPAFKKFLGIQDNSEFKSNESRAAEKRQVGFVAQEVEASMKKSWLASGLVAVPQHDGDPYTLRYAEFVMPLVKAVQELADQADASQKEIAALEETLRSYEGNTFNNDFGKTNDNSYRKTEINTTVPETSTRVNVLIYSSAGKQLKDIPVNQRGATSLSISHDSLSTGKYYCVIIADEIIVDTKRFIVQ